MCQVVLLDLVWYACAAEIQALHVIAELCQLIVVAAIIVAVDILDLHRSIAVSFQKLSASDDKCLTGAQCLPSGTFAARTSLDVTATLDVFLPRGIMLPLSLPLWCRRVCVR
jgi:hypothetical protein